MLTRRDVNLLLGMASAFMPRLTAAEPAPATTYPSRPIRWIVAWPPGGTTDVIARIVSNKVSEIIKQAIIIDNRGGAAGVIGMRAGVSAEPDGYTYLVSDSALSSVPNLYESLPFDPDKDLVPITMFARVPFVVVVRRDLPVNSLRELIALAKKKPNSLNFGSGGIGSPLQLAGELLRARAGIQWQHIPYRGSGPAVSALVTGEIDVLTPTLPNVVGLVRSGKIRALAVMEAKRSLLLPEVSTVDEMGLSDAHDFAYYGLSAPAGVPESMRDRVYEACIQALKDPDVRGKLEQVGAEPVGDTPSEYGDFIRADTKKWKSIIEAAHIPRQKN